MSTPVAPVDRFLTPDIFRAACDNSPSQQFLYTTGSTSIQLSNTDLCAEFGPELGKNFTPLRLDKCCEKGAPGQRLFITADNHIALEGARGQCADVKDGAVVDGMGKLQTWRCSAENINQVSTPVRVFPSGSSS